MCVDLIQTVSLCGIDQLTESEQFVNEMAVLIYLAVIVLIVLVVCFGVSIYRTNKYVENVPFVPWQIMKQFISLKSRTCDTYKIIEQMFGHQNGLGKFFIGTKLVVVCDDPVDVKTILLSRRCVDKPYLYRLIPGARNGLFSSHGKLRP